MNLDMIKLIAKIVIPIIVLGAAILLGITVYLTISSRSIGENIGKEMGIIAGRAVGSFDGVTKGIGEGENAGRAVGLSAEDITVTLANEIREVGRLRVLDMNVTLTHVFSVGAEDKPDSSKGYHALLVFEGTASYTVDLEQCLISVDNEAVKITIPHPELRVTIDPEKTQKRAEDNASPLLNGSSFDGYMGYINTLKQTNEKVKEELAGYEYMRAAAEKSAISAVERLAGSVRGDDKPIIVEFMNDSEIIEVVEKEVSA